jgi:hypothetical protein
MELSGQLHALAALPPGKAADTHWLEEWVSLRAGLDAVEKKNLLPLLGIEPWASNPPLYRLSYPDSIKVKTANIKTIIDITIT